MKVLIKSRKIRFMELGAVNARRTAQPNDRPCMKAASHERLIFRMQTVWVGPNPERRPAQMVGWTVQSPCARRNNPNRSSITALSARSRHVGPGSASSRESSRLRRTKLRGRADRIESVAASAHSGEQRRLVRTVEFVSQITDIDIDNVRFAVEVVFPYTIQNLLSAQQATLVLREKLQQCVFAPGEIDLNVIPPDAMGVEINPHAPEVEHRRLGLVRAPGECPDSRQQLFKSKWFGDVVIGATIERHQFAGKIVPRGQHDHADLASVLTKSAQDLKSIESRKHDIKENYVNLLGSGEQEPIFTGFRRKYLVTLSSQATGDHADQPRFIFNEQDSHTSKHSQSAGARLPTQVRP